MKPGRWPSILTVYGFGVLAVVAVAKFIPLIGDTGQHLGATAQQHAWLIALIGIPAALLAAISGALIDRFGARETLIASGLVGALANVGYYFAPTMAGFQGARLLEGMALVGIFSAGPALLMSTTEGRRRIVAMTFWSTYTPTGFSLGLMIAVAFAGRSNWRMVFALHGALLLFMSLLATQLPKATAATVAGAEIGSPHSIIGRWRELISAYRQRPAMQLALAFFLIVSIGFGTSTILPATIARAHGISVAESARWIALANLMMIVGAFVVAALLARGTSVRLVMVVLAIGCSVCGILLFNPAIALHLTIAALFLWSLLMGASMALLIAALPRVAPPTQRAAAAGLLSQSSAIATFANPPIWQALLANGAWLPVAALVAGGWLAATVVLALLPAVDQSDAHS
jgi:MFS family permease